MASVRVSPIRYMPASEMHPDPGPLALYQSVFPERYLRWSVARQCWDVRARDPITGEDYRIELVREVDDEGQLVYRPFDYPYVKRKLLDRLEVMRLGGVGFVQALADRNRQRDLKKLLTVQEEKNQWAREERRWLPALAAAHRKRWAYGSELKSEVSPLVTVGVNLKGGS